MESPSNGAPSATPTITITFTPDGQMRLETTGGIGPPQLWAAARLIELWGDSEFTQQQMLAAMPASPADRIVTPDGGKRRRLGLLGGRES